MTSSSPLLENVHARHPPLIVLACMVAQECSFDRGDDEDLFVGPEMVEGFMRSRVLPL